MIPGFQSDAFAVTTRDGRNCTLAEDVLYRSQAGQLYKIPAGTTTDGASTPAVIYSIIPPFGTYWRACVLHDAGYRNKLEVLNASGTEWSNADLCQTLCDILLKEAMQLDNVDEYQAETIFEAVHLFGHNCFRKTA